MYEDTYCRVCGTKLVHKYLEGEGDIPYCESCQDFRFRPFSVAISAIVHDPTGKNIAFIQQYGKKMNQLVAGYITQGESAESTLVREVKEELGLNVVAYTFNASEYFEPTNTMMVNFACRVDSADLRHTNEEVDYINWYPKEEAADVVEQVLAKKFVKLWLSKKQEI